MDACKKGLDNRLRLRHHCRTVQLRSRHRQGLIVNHRDPHQGLVSVLLCVVCGLGAAVRMQDQHFCGRCAIDYQRSQLETRGQRLPGKASAAS